MNYNTVKSMPKEDLSFNLKKIFFILISRKIFIIKTFFIVFVVFVLLTSIMPKKYKVESDLYINSTNNSNMAEINPYVIDEIGGFAINSISDKIMMNELEIIQSPLVINKVIKDNNLRYKPLFGFIPTKKTGQYITTEKFLKKKIKIENKKGTSVIEISYKDKDRELAYNVVNSIIEHYVNLHKELNSEKSKSDKKIIEAEYKKAKQNLNSKMSSVSGLPTNAMNATADLAAMSAFSKSAQQAMANLKNQYVEGEKSQIALREESEKVVQLASKLQWAKLVDEMSDSSKVLVLKEPRLLKEYEQASPKLLVNIIIGMIFATIYTISALIYKEYTDNKLSYSMLDDNIIYNLDKDFNKLKAEIMSNINKRQAFIFYEEVPTQILDKFKSFKDTIFIKATISNEFIETINGVDSIVTFASIGKTDSEKYILVKKMISNLDKKNNI